MGVINDAQAGIVLSHDCNGASRSHAERPDALPCVDGKGDG
jgi:hypothetical protein